MLTAAIAAGLGSATAADARAPANVPVTPKAVRGFQQPVMALDPRRPGRIAVAIQEGHDIRTCYLAVSRDGGRRWKTTALAGRGGRFPLGRDDLCWKPALAFGPDGTLYYVFQDGFATERGGRRVRIMVSRDGGRRFAPPRDVYSQPGSVQSWPAVAVDGRSGRVYVSWTRVRVRQDATSDLVPVFGTLQVASSTDHGKSFTTPVQPIAVHALAWGSLMSVGPDGRLYVAYQFIWPGARDDSLPNAVAVAHSTDGGRTFRGQILGLIRGTLDDTHPLYPAGHHRQFAVVAGRRAGQVAAAWWDLRSGEPARVLFSASIDGGTSWSTPLTVGIPRGGGRHHQHRPWLTAAGRNLDLVHYDRDGDYGPQHLYWSRSTDWGRSFSSPRALSSVPSDSRVGPPGEVQGALPTFGDFPGAVSTPSRLIAAWTDSRRGTRLNAKQDVYAAVVRSRR